MKTEIKTKKSKGGLMAWVDERFPLSSLITNHLTEYYAPKNFNFWYFFGSLALLVLVLQLATGIFLTMHYKPDAELAFGSVEYYARCLIWMAYKIYAFHRSFYVFCGCVFAYVSGFNLWFL